MGSIVLLKAGMVGGFGFIISLCGVIILLSSATTALREASLKVNKIPAFIAFLVVMIVELWLAYSYFSSAPGISTPSELEKVTMYSCLFSLSPSVAIVIGAFFYYLDAQRVLQKKE